MITKFVEAQSDAGNFGKFMLGWFDTDEYRRLSQVRFRHDGTKIPLIHEVGWGPEHLLVLDLQTGEGAIMRHGGYAKADLDKHAIWCCPLFEPFLEWLWARQPIDIDTMPDVVELTGVPLQLAGYRRPGPQEH